MDTIKKIEVNVTSRRIFAVFAFIFGIAFSLSGIDNAPLLSDASRFIGFILIGCGIGILLSLTNKLDILNETKS